MDGGFVCPSLAQALISEGKEQEVVMDHKTLLNKVMAALGSTQPPIFTVYDCGSNGVRVSIKLDVASTRYSVGKVIRVAVLDSEPFNSRLMAEKIAVSKAFKHLNDQHLIKIKDFSSRVAHELQGNSLFGDVNSAFYSFEKTVEQWEVVMTQCKKISVQLAAKEGPVDIEGEGGKAMEIYGDFNQFISMTLDMFNSHAEEARSKANVIETERKKYHARSTEKYHANLRKGYLQDVIIQAKDVLDYVLTYLGAGKAMYSNGPTNHGMVEGTVVFNMPDLPDVDYCGNLTIRGKATRSREAEEDAAFEALKYMEKKFKLKIVDLNHAERVAAEKEQRLLVRLLCQIIDAADNVNVYWGKMAKSVSTEKSAYPLEGDGFTPGQHGAKEKDAYKFCVNCLDELVIETTKRYQDCALRFEEFENLQSKVDEMKCTLQMD